ncbi:hypothetical protein ACFO1S_10575 [Cohnella boryungensis]|uniref:Uncharacterized protein n=2 Tax=Cohnella boryungensis TaxID=768479 RepID=A0ABV8SAG9_9BACL
MNTGGDLLDSRMAPPSLETPSFQAEPDSGWPAENRELAGELVLPPDARLVSQLPIESNEAAGFIAVCQSDIHIDELRLFYRHVYSNKGFALVEYRQASTVNLVGGTFAHSILVSIAPTEDGGGGSTVVITYGIRRDPILPEGMAQKINLSS